MPKHYILDILQNRSEAKYNTAIYPKISSKWVYRNKTNKNY